MKRILFSLIALTSGLSSWAQKTKFQAEKETIREMCGCYEVSFDYAETFATSNEYEYHDRYRMSGLEYIVVAGESDRELILQHLLVINDTFVIKHWRQDWLYENREIFEYQRNLEWQRKKLTKESAEGTWTQNVYQVDDSPRYQGNATWVIIDGKKYWESQVAAPLPRREFTKRSDYNVLVRNNKHQIKEYGHVHELDNAKVLRTETEDSTLVYEKGMNTYRRVDESRCDPAKKYWAENQSYWADVRAVWNSILSEVDYVNLKRKVNNQKLYEQIFELGDELVARENYSSSNAQKKIKAIIESYLSKKPSSWTSSNF